MSQFKGFSKAMIEFFGNLEINNNKEWFDAHKKEYERFVKEPAMAFVTEMGEALKSLVPEINAIPKVNKSLFRLNRDIRFSKDKSPYKTNMGIWFWEGAGKRMECPGFYFHFDVNQLMLGAGFYVFPKHLLESFRKAAVGKISGPLLQKMAEKMADAGLPVKGEHYKRVPNGFDGNHVNARYLLYNGLHVGSEADIPPEFFSEQLIDYAFERFKKMLPLHEWLKTSLAVT